MSSLQLIWSRVSQPSRALKSFLADSGIPHTERELDMFKGEHKSPEIIALNPAGTVPFIIENGEVMVESVAIMRYLSDKYSAQAAGLYGTDAMTQYYVDKWADYYTNGLRPAFGDIMNVFLGARVAEQRPLTDFDKHNVGKALKEVFA